MLVATSYPRDLGDWRGLFIRHLADALGRRDDLDVGLWAPPGEHHPAVRPLSTDAERAWLERLMAAGGIAHLWRRAPLSGPLEAFRLLRHLHAAFRRDTPDVRHVNWLQNALPLPDDGRPLVVSALGTDMKLLGLPLVRQRLRRVFARRATAIHPNADWMVPPLRAAFGDLADVRFLSFGIDPGWFAVERAPATPPRWLAVTRLTRDKLGPLLERGGDWFAGGARELHLFGPMQEQVALPAWAHYHGPVGPDVLRRDWFPTATGLVTLSRHAEGRPQVMLEAMAAGLPILASDMPAHAGFLRHGETGWLCDPRDDLAPAFTALEAGERNRAIGMAARDWVAREVGTWDDCVARYVDSYRTLLGT
ncbi:hypothetical protein GCM10028862_07720 [Luteimonas pelagia]